MDILLSFFVVALILFFIIGLPIVLIIYPYKKLRKTKFKKYAFISPMLVIGFITYIIYGAIYPSDDFYQDDFETETQMKFPQSGVFLSEDADYPDTHGHYTSAAVVELSPGDYKQLLDKIDSDVTFRTDTIIGESDIYQKVTEGIQRKQIKKIAHKGQIVIGFVNDNKRIILERRLSDNY